MNRLSFRALSTLVALLGIFALLTHLELRASAEASELGALRGEIAALAVDRASSNDALLAPRPAPALRYTFDSDAIQSVARAVAQLDQQRAAAAAGSADLDARPPRSVEEETAVAHASEVATQVVARGRISRDEVLEMRHDLQAGSATDAERDALRSQIAVAINAQKLVPEDPRFIFP